jgi:peptidoglycan hydrolase-like protein with peptidoglycan-binding domain
MSTKKLRIFSIAMAGGLAVTGATVAGMTSGHAPAHAALAAHMASSPPVNLDNCAVLAEGYTGGCAAQLQTELNADNGTNMTVDGIFGRQTKDAVITFQQNHQIVPADGRAPD